MTSSRKFGIFVIVFAVVYPILYLVAFVMNWAAFTYHSALGEWALGADRPRQGTPAMYWYGWIATSLIGTLVIATIAAYLPDSLTRRLPAAAAWVVPLAAFATAAGLMAHQYFMR
jgi:hypothetical protein